MEVDRNCTMVLNRFWLRRLSRQSGRSLKRICPKTTQEGIRVTLKIKSCGASRLFLRIRSRFSMGLWRSSTTCKSDRSTRIWSVRMRLSNSLIRHCKVDESKMKSRRFKLISWNEHCNSTRRASKGISARIEPANLSIIKSTSNLLRRSPIFIFSHRNQVCFQIYLFKCTHACIHSIVYYYLWCF